MSVIEGNESLRCTDWEQSTLSVEIPSMPHHPHVHIVVSESNNHALPGYPEGNHEKRALDVKGLMRHSPVDMHTDICADEY